MLIAPSVLAADYSQLDRELKKIESADFVHLDVMDGHFVPNISFGAPVIKALRKLTNQIFDCHLMISHPLKYIKDFADAGADIVTFHLECDDDPDEVIDEIIKYGMKPSMSVKPGTDVEALYPYLSRLHMVLVMTVEPGFGGQKFMPDMMEKVKKLKAKCAGILVEVDGGISEATIGACRQAGVDVCVAGTSVFKAENPKEMISFLQNI